MKILFYVHGITGGGGERVLVTLANEFANRGEFVCIATNTREPFAYSVNDKVILRDLYQGSYKTHTLLSNTYNSIILRNNVRRIAKQEHPDVIVAFMSALGCTVIASTLGLGIPVIVSEHTNVSRYLGLYLNLRRRLFYPFANAITVLTRHDTKLWRYKYHNVVYMPNPIALMDIHSNTEERHKTILAVGRVKQWRIKGFDNLLQCWSNLCSKYPEWNLKIVGESDEVSRNFLNGIAKNFSCSNYEFLGFRKDIYELMKQSAVFCLSSRIEGLPMVLIEAMNAGCCCVSFDVKTGPNEIIQHGKSGLIAKNQNIEDLTKCLDEVMSNENIRKYFAKNAPYSIEKYSINRVVNRWYILFNKLVQK